MESDARSQNVIGTGGTCSPASRVGRQKDPRIKAGDAVLRASTALQVQVENAINQTVTMVNILETWRKRIQDQAKNHPSGAVSAALGRLEGQILTVEKVNIPRQSRGL